MAGLRSVLTSIGLYSSLLETLIAVSYVSGVRKFRRVQALVDSRFHIRMIADGFSVTLKPSDVASVVLQTHMYWVSREASLTYLAVKLI